MKPQADPKSSYAPSKTFVSLCSLLIIIHFFCLFVAFSGNLMRSELQDQLLRQLFRPYLQSLNFDPDATPYHLTRGTVEDVDHRWEVLPAGERATDRRAWITIPSQASRWGESRKRWQRLGKLTAFQSVQENEDAAAEVARGVARYAVHHENIRAQQIRCRRVHNFLEWSGTAEEPREIPYAANVVIDSKDRVSVARIAETRETALPATTPSESAP